MNDVAAEADVTDDRHSKSAEGKTPGPNVIVVDDNVDSADTLGLLLEGLGATVRVHYDAGAALQSLQLMPANALVVDIAMPGMNGHELASHIRRDSRLDGTVLIALSGWNRPEDVKLSRDAGFDHHLTKPLALNALLQLLNTL